MAPASRSKRVSRRFALVQGLVLGGLLVASGAAQGRVPEVTLAYSRAPVSTIVSRRDFDFRLAHVREAGARVTVLAHGTEPLPVAVIRTAGSRVSVERLVIPQGGLDAAALELATLEHLYTLVLRMEPEASFCLVRSPRNCELVKNRRSHAAFLRELAQARQHAAARSGGPVAAWHVVSMKPAAPAGSDADEVGVRVTMDNRPLQGMNVFFNRAPHSSCTAKVGSDGVATCHLVDQHGDEESHAHEGKVPVVVTFPGDVRAERVLLPTTLVMEPKP
jgi:hypothetical protein